MKKDTVVAIVPAFNEAEKIGEVLEALTACEVLTEILVIDDGSQDGTYEVASGFEGVKVIRNERNLGKAQSMQRGVEESTSSILFFCDADLQNLTPEIVEGIVGPVLRNEYAMFMGLLDNPMQKTLRMVSLLSGQRAMRREFWNKLPDCFKRRYRIEAGLNDFARKNGGYGCARFNFQQSLKEEKYGFWKGMFLRSWMYCDVMVSYGLVVLYRMHFLK